MEVHHHTYKTGGMHAMAQRIHHKIIAKIHKLVEVGISELPEVNCALKLYVTTLPQSPHKDDRAYYATNADLSNHIYKAKALSKLDQKNLAMKVDKWKKINQGVNIYFRATKNQKRKL